MIANEKNIHPGSNDVNACNYVIVVMLTNQNFFQTKKNLLCDTVKIMSNLHVCV